MTRTHRHLRQTSRAHRQARRTPHVPPRRSPASRVTTKRFPAQRVAMVGLGLLLVLSTTACIPTLNPRPEPTGTATNHPESPAGSTAQPLDHAGTALRVSYRDVSTPPRYHRSYRLEADASGAAIAVSAYGAHVGSGRVEMDPEVWETAVAAVEPVVADSGSCPPPYPSGATSYSLEVWVGDTRVRTVEANTLCWRDDPVHASIAEAVAPLLDLFDEDEVFRPDHEPDLAVSAQPEDTGPP